MSHLCLALAQINFKVGDISGNTQLILDAAKKAHQSGVHVLLTPELSLTGYSPEDWLLRQSFYDEVTQAIQYLNTQLEQYAPHHVVIGHPHYEEGKCYNALSVLSAGKTVSRTFKRVLPNHGVFDEHRYFTQGSDPGLCHINTVNCGLLICEDFWHSFPALDVKEKGAQLLLAINASPYEIGKPEARIAQAQQRVRETGLPLVYLNLVGGQDELVFDGGSFVMDAQGQLVGALPQFKEAMAVLEFNLGTDVPRFKSQDLIHFENKSLEAEVYSALVFSLQDYVRKNNFSRVLIGLSGGIDSALVLAIACDALGSDQVHAVMMPSPYTSEISWEAAQDIVTRLGVRYSVVAITPIFENFLTTLSDEFEKFNGQAPDVTEENIQARIRGTLLMALSNKQGALVLTTGNKSELAVGYCTLYGDMAGGFAVIKDLLKTQVYALANYRNQSHEFTLRNVIPEIILTRPATAELRPNQTDQDSLPPYDLLDGILSRYIEDNASRETLVAEGYAPDMVDKIIYLIHKNEYKRQQGPVGVRITGRAFGKDWRYPIS